MAKLTALSLGWGVQSFTLAAMDALRSCDCELCQRWSLRDFPALDAAIHADTTWEREITYLFAHAMSPWLRERNVALVTVSDAKQAARVVEQSDPPFFTLAPKATDSPSAPADPGNSNVFMPAYSLDKSGRRLTARKRKGQLKRQCTGRWKIEPIRRWLRLAMRERKIKRVRGAVEQWLGISMDELERAKDSDVQYIQHRYPLLELGMSRADCKTWLLAHNLPIPPKSRCKFCPYQDRNSWRRQRAMGGKDWAVAVQVDAAIRDKRPPHPLFVHRGRLPLEQAVEIIPLAQLPPEDQHEEDFSEGAACDSGYCFL